MRVLMTGATGFIGRALVPALRRDGHTVIAWARSERRARGRLGAEVDILSAEAGIDALVAELEHCDAVVNLAGEPIVGHRWTAARRQILRESRIGVTETLVHALARARTRPKVLVSGSAVGYYGDRADETLTESSRPGAGFLADLCRDWEAAAQKADAHGVRVVTIRTGVVLGRDGGALASMLPPFLMGAGGPVGSGRQFMPWIHLHDYVRLIVRALNDDRVRGPVNGVAPTPVRSLDFAKALGRALHRPAILPLPAFVLRIIFGQAASVLLESQRVVPDAALRLGFQFHYVSLDAALADVLGGPTVRIQPLAAPVDDRGVVSSRQYLAARRPIYELKTSTTVARPVEDTFAFFSRAENLGLLTPAAMRFSLVGAAPAIGENVTIDYTLRVGLLPVSWRSRIVGWRPNAGFVDLQEQGPYRSWWHEHAFRADGTATVMEDRVCYAPPLGPIGRVVNRFFIAPALRRVFRYRADVIRLRFGTGAG